MKISDEEAGVRRAPRQERSRQTVEVVLDAVERVLKKEGSANITTNRIAEAAGVSIGSVYQYFPDKQSIFAALHQRHVEQVSQVIERVVSDPRPQSLESRACTLLVALMDVHDADPRLHEIISEAVPESAAGFRRALEATFERLLSMGERSPRHAQLSIVLPLLVDALVHGAVAKRPMNTPIDALKREATRAILAYLEASPG